MELSKRKMKLFPTFKFYILLTANMKFSLVTFFDKKNHILKIKDENNSTWAGAFSRCSDCPDGLKKIALKRNAHNTVSSPVIILLYCPEFFKVTIISSWGFHDAFRWPLMDYCLLSCCLKFIMLKYTRVAWVGRSVRRASMCYLEDHEFSPSPLKLSFYSLFVKF